MKDVEVKVDELKAQLEANRGAHRGLYEKAWAAYEKRVLKETKRLLKYLESNGPKDHTRVLVLSRLPRPEDHTKDYDVAIAMLEEEVRETLTLTQQEFSQFWMDDWGWKSGFVGTNAFYAVQ